MLSNTAAEPLAVSLVVVNYQGGAHIASCLESLTASQDVRFELFVVDNASTDGSAAVIERFAAGRANVEVVTSRQNLGYAGAVNLVLDRCRGKYVAVCNMDLVAEPGWLAPLVAFLDEQPDYAAVNPMLLLMDGEHVNAAGLDLHVSGLGFNSRLGSRKTEMPQAPFAVDGVHGALFLCRAEVLRAMGGLDASGFLYHEDVRLSWALRSMGYRMACVPSSIVRHEYRLSMHPEKLYLLERNRWTLLGDALAPGTLARILPALAVTEAMLLGYATLKGPRFLVAKLRSVQHALAEQRRRPQQRKAWREHAACSDQQLLQGLSWRYAWSQFVSLARERGAPRRPFVAPRPT